MRNFLLALPAILMACAVSLYLANTTTDKNRVAYGAVAVFLDDQAQTPTVSKVVFLDSMDVCQAMRVDLVETFDLAHTHCESLAGMDLTGGVQRP